MSQPHCNQEIPRWEIKRPQHEIKKTINKCVVWYAHKAKTMSMSQIMSHIHRQITLMQYTTSYQREGPKWAKRHTYAYLYVWPPRQYTLNGYQICSRSIHYCISRGLVKNIFSDMSTYFVRTDKELRELIETQTEELEKKSLTNLQGWAPLGTWKWCMNEPL